MEPRQLTSFLTAARTQNFRKAAELCLIAQPVLSRQISVLEAEPRVARSVCGCDISCSP
ncbi:MAG TPA: LysR family transcriptional regulator [Ktedonobacteraceae bacterium]|nr:LysR family transcriptional regulator [Ktedonobacteraceae bacterium]